MSYLVSNACGGVYNGYSALGEWIGDTTTKWLGTRVATVLQQTYWGLPLTIPLALLPITPPLTLLAGGIAAIAVTILKFPKETKDSMYFGLRTFFIIEAIKAPILRYTYWPLAIASAVDLAIKMEELREGKQLSLLQN